MNLLDVLASQDADDELVATSMQDAPPPVADRTPPELRPKPAPVVAENKPLPAVSDEAAKPDYGPAMLALDERERNFVLYSFHPDISGAQAARLAGFGKPTDHSDVFARLAWRLKNENSRVQDAIKEMHKRGNVAIAPDVSKALGQIVSDPTHPQRAKVALAMKEHLDPTVTKQDISVTHHEVKSPWQEQLDALRTMRQLNVPREKMQTVLGHALPLLEAALAKEEALSQPPIDAEYIEVKNNE